MIMKLSVESFRKEVMASNPISRGWLLLGPDYQEHLVNIKRKQKQTDCHENYGSIFSLWLESSTTGSRRPAPFGV